MFLGEKDSDHNPPGKTFIIQLKNIALWLLIVSALFSSKSTLVLSLVIAGVLVAYYLYLIFTKQTYMQFLSQQREMNEEKIEKYKK